MKNLTVFIFLIVATTAYSQSLRLTWDDNSDNEEAFQIQRSDDGIEFYDIGGVPADVTTFTDTTVEPLAEYWYRVRGVREFSKPSGWSNTAHGIVAALPDDMPPPSTNPDSVTNVPPKRVLNIEIIDEDTAIISIVPKSQP